MHGRETPTDPGLLEGGEPSVVVMNPNDGKQTQLHNAIKEALLEATGEARITSPVFGRDVPVALDITFFVCCPGYNFFPSVTRFPRSRSARNIMPQFQDKKCTVALDVDNLVKFIMDKPFKGLLLHDDRQVISIRARKAYNNFGECDGHTVVALSKE